MPVSEISERLDRDDLFLLYSALVWRKSAGLVMIYPPENLNERTFSALNSLIERHSPECIIMHCNDKIISNQTMEIMEKKDE